MSKRGKSAHIGRASALLIALVIPAPAVAQSSQSSAIDDARENARVHIGPLYATPSVQLTELGIDRNVFNVYGGNQQSDFTATLVPKADVWLPIARRALLQVTPAADLVWYEKYETERSIDPRVAMRGELYLQRITLFGEGGYVNTRQRPNQEIDVRARHVEQTATAGVDVSLKIGRASCRERV